MAAYYTQKKFGQYESVKLNEARQLENTICFRQKTAISLHILYGNKTGFAIETIHNSNRVFNIHCLNMQYAQRGSLFCTTLYRSTNKKQQQTKTNTHVYMYTQPYMHASTHICTHTHTHTH